MFIETYRIPFLRPLLVYFIYEPYSNNLIIVVPIPKLKNLTKLCQINGLGTFTYLLMWCTIEFKLH